MFFKIIQETDTLTYVDLSRPPSQDIEDDGPVSVRDALVFLGFAMFASPHSAPVTRPHRRRFLYPELPRCNELLRVTVCHVESPSDFYIQVVCNLCACAVCRNLQLKSVKFFFHML